MAGYSGTPLYKKLGIKAQTRLLTKNAPVDYLEWLGDVPADATISARLKQDVNMIHVFTLRRAELARFLPVAKQRIVRDGCVWVSWPKRAAKVATDITEDVVRELALPLGLVDIKVCAVSDVWSGLKLVIRKELR